MYTRILVQLELKTSIRLKIVARSKAWRMRCTIVHNTRL